MDRNILRDTVLLQTECLHFEAYVHVCAIMWRVVWKELRGLTNSKGLEINPLQLNDLYDSLYDMGTLLQTDNSLQILEVDYRPWPHVYRSGKRAKQFYEKIEKGKDQDLERLTAFRGRGDVDKYISILQNVLKLFGAGIHSSLRYTMGDYFKSTEGTLRNELRPVRFRVLN